VTCLIIKEGSRLDDLAEACPANVGLFMCIKTIKKWKDVMLGNSEERTVKLWRKETKFCAFIACAVRNTHHMQPGSGSRHTIPYIGTKE